MRLLSFVVVTSLSACGSSKSKEQEEQEAQARITAEAQRKKELKEWDDGVRKEAATVIAKVTALAKTTPPDRSKALAPSRFDESHALIVTSNAEEMQRILSGRVDLNRLWWGMFPSADLLFKSTAQGAAMSNLGELRQYVHSLDRVVVLTQVEYDAPHVNEAETGFHRGVRKAEARVYAYPSLEYLGGVPVLARSSDKIEWSEKAGEAATRENKNGLLELDLQQNFQKALLASIAAGGSLPAMAPISYKLPTGWQTRDTGKPNVLVSAAKGTDPVLMQTAVLLRLPKSITFDTEATCQPFAMAMAEPLNGTVRSVEAFKPTPDRREAVCEFSIEHGERTAAEILVEAKEGPPLLFQCDGPSPNKEDPDCLAIWDSFDLFGLR